MFKGILIAQQNIFAEKSNIFQGIHGLSLKQDFLAFCNDEAYVNFKSFRIYIFLKEMKTLAFEE